MQMKLEFIRCFNKISLKKKILKYFNSPYQIKPIKVPSSSYNLDKKQSWFKVIFHLFF